MKKNLLIYKTLAKKASLSGFVLMVIMSCFSCGNKKQKELPTADSFSLLWEITGNGLAKPSYLYGTIHMYDTSVFKIPQEIYQLIDTCPNFALELDFNNMDQSVVAQRIAITNPDSTLDKLIAPEVFEKISQVPFIKLMGEAATKTKPFFISSYLMIEDPMSMKSVDMDLNNYAGIKNKKISGLETMEEQLDMVDKISLSEQAQSITDFYEYCKKENLTLAEGGKQMFGKLMLAYKNQDIDAFLNLENELKMTASTPAADSALIAVRNINMADRISDFIKNNEPLFVGVGTLHLPDYKGMRGVITLLKEKGYNMRPILIKL